MAVMPGTNALIFMILFPGNTKSAASSRSSGFCIAGENVTFLLIKPNTLSPDKFQA